MEEISGLINPLLPILYDDFKSGLDELFGNFLTCISIDENNDYILLNKSIFDNYDLDNNNIDNKFTTTCYKKYQENNKQYIKKIFSFRTPIIQNNQAIDKIKNIDYSNLEFYISYEGVHIVIYYDNEKWNLFSEKSIGAKDIINKVKDNESLFFDTINYLNTKNETNLIDQLDKENIYHFILVHHKNNGLVEYNHYGCGYKNLILIREENKENIELNNLKDKKLFETPQQIYFSCVDEMIAKINQVSYENMLNKKISIEGFIIKDIATKNLYKLQTNIYQQISLIKPMHKNIYEGYLDLFQQNKLNEYLPFLSNYSGEIIHRISMSLRTISKEFLNIYHYTRKNKNKETYDLLSESYKKVIYGVHGVYIGSRKNDFENSVEIESAKIDNKSITVHDIYYYIKSLPFSTLRQIYFDRDYLIEKIKTQEEYEELKELMSFDCMFIITQTKLMKDY